MNLGSNTQIINKSWGRRRKRN